MPAEAEAKGEGTWRIADREHDTLEERVVHLVKEMEMGDKFKGKTVQRTKKVLEKKD